MAKAKFKNWGVAALFKDGSSVTIQGAKQIRDVTNKSTLTNSELSIVAVSHDPISPSVTLSDGSVCKLQKVAIGGR